MQSIARTAMTGLVCALLLIAPALGTVINWIADVPGFWDVPTNWNPAQAPVSGDDARHTTKSNDISVRNDETCRSFEGKSGSAHSDRFLLIESEKILTIEENLFKTPGFFTNFEVQFEDGVTFKTKIVVGPGGGNGPVRVEGINFIAASAESGDKIDIRVFGSMKDSSIDLGDSVTISVGGLGVEGDVTGDGSQSWSIANNGFVDVKGNVSGVDMTFGSATSTSAADTTTVWINSVGAASGTAIHDEWKLRNWANVTITGTFTCADTLPVATILVRQDAQMSVGSPPFDTDEPSIIEGEWTLQDQASMDVESWISDGVWKVRDSAELTVEGKLSPDELTIDGGTVTCETLGATSGVWIFAIKNSGEVVPNATSHRGIGDGEATNSTFTYMGTGNIYNALGPIKIGGTLVSSGITRALAMDTDRGVVITSKLVRIVESQPVIIDFDTEAVTVKLLTPCCGPPFYDGLEVFGPDYAGDNPDNVLFTDSPCTRRWKKVIAGGAGRTVLDNNFTSTPITCTTSCTGGKLPEALYVKDLEVETDLTLQVNGLNVYYTGTLTNNGFIKDGTETYEPIQLTPTTYGDFDGNGEGNETPDVDRFNAHFPSEIGDPDPNKDPYDPLVDWNCDGFIDCLDRQRYIDNWNPTGIEDDNC